MTSPVHEGGLGSRATFRDKDLPSHPVLEVAALLGVDDRTDKPVQKKDHRGDTDLQGLRHEAGNRKISSGAGRHCLPK